MQATGVLRSAAVPVTARRALAWPGRAAGARRHADAAPLLTRWRPVRRPMADAPIRVPDLARAGLAERTDEALIARVAEADHDAFRLLVGRHLERVRRIAWRMLADPGEADEVAQEAFLRVWVHAASFDPTRGARFTTWLHRLVLNLCTDRRRRRPAHVPLAAAAAVADPAPHPLLRLVETESARRVAAALADLPERQRMAVVLSYYERLSNAEAAAGLGVTVAGLEALLVRARRALRRRLQRR